MTKKFNTIFAMLAIFAVAIMTYVFTHELGHGIAAMISGGSITRLSIVLAQTWVDGMGTSQWSVLLLHIGGMLLPVLLFLIALFFYNKKISNFCYQLIYGLFLKTYPQKVI